MQNVAKPKEESFVLEYNLKNASLTSGPTQFKKGEILTIKIAASSGYAINQNQLSIVMGSKNITSSCSFVAGNKDEDGQILDCTITIPSSQTKLIGKREKITLILEAFEIPEDWVFPIVYQLDSVTKSSSTPVSFRAGDEIVMNFSSITDYAINSASLKVMMGSVDVTSKCITTKVSQDEEGQILEYKVVLPAYQTSLINKGESLIVALNGFEIIKDWVHGVVFTLLNGIKHPEPTSFRAGDVLTINFESLDGYAINMGSLRLRLGSKQLTSSNYVISNENYGYKNQLFGFTLTIPAATTNMAVEGDSLNITLNGVEAEIEPNQYTVTYHLKNITEPSTKYITEKTAFTEIFEVDKNPYAIEVDDIVVKIGESNYNGFITTVKNSSRDGATKLELSIPASAVTGNIDIYMDAIEYFDVTYAFARNDGSTADNISVENKVTRIGRQKPFTIKLVAAQGSFILDYGIKIGDASTELGDVIEGTHYTKTETTYEANINGTDYTYVTAVSITMLDKGVVDDIQFGATEGYMAVQLYNVEFDVMGDTDYNELKSVVNLPAPIAVESGNTATFDTSNILSAENEKYYNIIEYKVYIKDENGNLTNPIKYNVTDTLSITNVIHDLVVKAVVYVDYYNITWNNGKYGYTIENKPTKVTRNGAIDLSIQFHNPERVAYPKYTMGNTTGSWTTESSANNYYAYRLQIAKVTSDVILNLDSVELYTISYNTDSDRLIATDVSPITVEHNTAFTAEMMARPAEYVGGAHIKPNSWYVHVHNLAGDVQNVTSACTFTTTKAVSEADGSEVVTAFKVTVPGDVVYGHIEIGAIGQYTQKNTYTVTWAVNDNQYLDLVNLPETQAVFYNETYHNNTPLTFTQEFKDWHQISPTELISVYTEAKGDDSWEYAGKITPQSSGLYTRLNVTSNIKFVVNIVPNYHTVSYNLTDIAGPEIERVKSGNDFVGTFSRVKDLTVVDKDSIKVTIGGKEYTSYTLVDTILPGNTDGPQATKMTIPASAITGNIVITMASKPSYWTITIKKQGNNKWSYVSGASPEVTSSSEDKYIVEKNGAFSVTYKFTTNVEGEIAHAPNYYDKANNKYKIWEGDNGGKKMSLDNVMEDITVILSYNQKAMKTISFQNLNNAKFVVTSNVDKPSTTTLKDYYVSGDALTLWQNSEFSGYIWPLNETGTSENVLANYNYTATAYMGNETNLFSGTTIRLPYEAASSDNLGLVDDMVINATFMSKDIAPVQIVFNDQQSVNASVTVSGSVQTKVNNTQTANIVFNKTGYNLYYDKVEPAIERTSEYDNITVSGVTGVPGVDEIYASLSIKGSGMTDMKYKITKIAYSSDAGVTWKEITGNSPEQFISESGTSTQQSYTGIDTTYVSGLTIIKVYVSILQQDAVTITVTCDDHSSINGQKNYTINAAYGSSLNWIPLTFDEYYTIDKVTSPQGTPSVELNGGKYYINPGSTAEKDIQFTVKSKANYWTVTKNVDTEAFTLLTSIPDKVEKGKSLTFDVKNNNIFKYNYSSVSFKRGTDVKNYLSNDWTEKITNGIRVTIPTTETTGNIVINLNPDLKDIIPVTFNLSNGDGTQFFFSPLMDANAFVNTADFVQYTDGATNGIKHQQTVDLYMGSILMGSAYTSNYDKTKQWSIANITSNYDNSVVHSESTPLESNSISFDTSRISLNNLSGYTVNVLYTTAYNSKVIYAIRNETNDSYYVTFGGSTPWSVQASDQYGSGGGTSYNSNCASIALKNATGEPSRWYTRAFRPTAVDADIENRSYYVGHYTDEERTIDNIMEVGSSGSRAQVFEYNQYNALNPANPGYANWNPDSTGDSIQYGLEINGVVSLFKDENVAFTEENSVKSGVVYGIRYQISNDGGVTWSEEVASAGYDNIEPNVACNAGFTAPKLYTEIKGVENNRTLGLLKIIIVLKPNYGYY